MMSDVRRSMASRKMLICMLLVLPAQAHAFDLTGAWASGTDQCGQVFRKNGGRVTFAKDSDIHGAGFIAAGNQLKGRVARCTVKSKNEVSGTVNLVAACASDIMLSSVQFSLKVVDDNKITRFFPGMEGMEVNYYRCAL
jgi:hypothetical protein